MNNMSQLMKQKKELLESLFRSHGVSISRLTRKNASELVVDRITDVQRYLVSVKLLRNMNSPLGCLPPEILVEIFRHCLDDTPNVTPTLNAIRLSHVCHQWRILAISISSLWNRIELSNPHIVRMSLQRCSVGPLHVSMFVDTSRMNSNLEKVAFEWNCMLLQSCLGRVKTLRLKANSSVMMKVMGYFEIAMTALSELSLSAIPLNVDRNHHANLSWLKATGNKPPPLLRRLTLERVIIPFDTGIYQNLVYLKLHKQLADLSLSMDAFVQVLERCSELEVLDTKFLGQKLNNAIQEYPVPTRTVHLPFLKELFVEENAIDVGHLLAHISIPNTTAVFIKTRNDRINHLHQLVTRIFPRDRSLFPHLSDVRSFKYDISNDSEVIFTLYHLQIVFMLDRSKCGIEEDVHVHCRNFLLPFISELSPLNAVEEMEIQCGDGLYMELENWQDVLNRVPSLKVLSYLHRLGTTPWVRLSLDTVLGKKQQNGNVYCPLLQRLVLSNITFETEDLYTVDEDLPLSVENLELRKVDAGNLLVDGLRCRAELGYRLKELKLVDVHDLTVPNAVLLEYVDHLEWASSSILWSAVVNDTATTDNDTTDNDTTDNDTTDNDTTDTATTDDETDSD